MLKVGSEAPDFSVSLHTGETFRLSEFRGKKNVVVYFYPKDFTKGCTAQACSFSDHFREIASLDLLVRETLAHATGDDSADTRVEAVRALRKLRRASLAEALRSIASHDRSQAVRYEAEVALLELREAE